MFNVVSESIEDVGDDIVDVAVGVGETLADVAEGVADLVETLLKGDSGYGDRCCDVISVVTEFVVS
jgi:hypothetical protein